MLTLKENKICESAVNNFIKSQQTTDSLIQIKKITANSQIMLTQKENKFANIR